MLEIEIKAYCDDRAEVIRRIEALGGRFLKLADDRDIYYSHPSRDFSQTDEAFRIRVENSTSLLTYKGPKIGERSKTRFEREAAFNDIEAMKDILSRLGFTVAGEVHKTRRYYSLKGIEICVDSVDGLGEFIELEIKGGDREAGEAVLFKMADKLGLFRFERKSYLEMLLEKR
ncbi:MAG: class IV adenylate cyclase [Spirochaetes bacterium]|nr:class IV adenylate cyclase [Spirochaetota bacterium]